MNIEQFGETDKDAFQPQDNIDVHIAVLTSINNDEKSFIFILDVPLLHLYFAKNAKQIDNE